MNIVKSLLLGLSTLLLLSLWACSSNQQTTQTSSGEVTHAKGQSTVVEEGGTPNLLQIALGSEDHSTLVAASQAAEIEDILVNAGPITLFAPTNAAFEALPEGTVEFLLKPENKSALKNILYYHAAPGKYLGDLLKDGQQLYMAQGGFVAIADDNGQMTANGAKIVATVEASNGVVHVVDAVLLPPEQ